jgi:hypothetical protein
MKAMDTYKQTRLPRGGGGGWVVGGSGSGSATGKVTHHHWRIQSVSQVSPSLSGSGPGMSLRRENCHRQRGSRQYLARGRGEARARSKAR